MTATIIPNRPFNSNTKPQSKIYANLRLQDIDDVDQLVALKEVIRYGKEKYLKSLEAAILKQQKLLQQLQSEKNNIDLRTLGNDTIITTDTLGHYDRKINQHSEIIKRLENINQFIRNLPENSDDLTSKIEAARSADELNLIINEVMLDKYALLHGKCFNLEQFRTVSQLKQALNSLHQREEHQREESVVANKEKNNVVLPEELPASEPADHLPENLKPISANKLDELDNTVKKIEHDESDITNQFLSSVKKENRDAGKKLQAQYEILLELTKKAENAKAIFHSKRKTSERLYVASSAFTFISTIANFLSFFPVLHFVTEPLHVTSSFLHHVSLDAAYHSDPNASKIEKQAMKDHLTSIKRHNIAEITTGIVSTGFLIASAFAPVLLPVSLALITLSNLTSIKVAEKELEREILYGVNDKGKNCRIEGLRARISGRKALASGTFFMGLATLAVIASIAFPPFGLALGVSAGICTAISIGCSAFGAYQRYQEKVSFTKAENSMNEDLVQNLETSEHIHEIETQLEQSARLSVIQDNAPQQNLATPNSNNFLLNAASTAPKMSMPEASIELAQIPNPTQASSLMPPPIHSKSEPPKSKVDPALNPSEESPKPPSRSPLKP